MAQVIIRRVIPVWQGDWAPLAAARATLEVDDMVLFNGSSWIVRRQHIADPDPVWGTQPSGKYSKTLWLKLSGGLFVPDWTEINWDSTKRYYEGVSLIYGAASWISRTITENEVPNEHPNQWLKASSAAIYWMGEFDNSVQYIRGALIHYQNSVYYALANTSVHQPVSISGEPDYQQTVQGLFPGGNYQFLNTYTSGEIVAVRGDVQAPKFGGRRWVMNAIRGTGAGGSPAADPNWVMLAEGLDFADTPSATTRYYGRDILLYNDDIYSCREDTILGDNPTIAPNKFTRMINQTLGAKPVVIDESRLASDNVVRIKFVREDSFIQPNWALLYGYGNNPPTTGGGISTGGGTGGGASTGGSTTVTLFPASETAVDILLVAGGGAGADPDCIRASDPNTGMNQHEWKGAGGGGAGGVLSIMNYPMNGDFKIKVGKGATHWEYQGTGSQLIDHNDNIIYKTTGGGSQGHVGASSGGEKSSPFPNCQWWAQYTAEPQAPEIGSRGGRGDTGGFTGGGGGGGGAGGPGGDAPMDSGGDGGLPIKWLDNKEYAGGGAGQRQIRFDGLQNSTNPHLRSGKHYDSPGSGGLGAIELDNNWDYTRSAAIAGDLIDTNIGKKYYGKDGTVVLRIKKGACAIVGLGDFGLTANVETIQDANGDDYEYYYFSVDDEIKVTPNIDPNA